MNALQAFSLALSGVAGEWREIGIACTPTLSVIAGIFHRAYEASYRKIGRLSMQQTIIFISFWENPSSCMGSVVRCILPLVFHIAIK
jgi:hypothetical protein